MPETTDNRKKVTAWIAIGALVIVFGYLLLLAVLGMAGSIVVDPQAMSPELRTPWSVFLWLAGLGTTTQVIYAALITVVSTGLGYLGALYTTRRSLAVLCGIALGGIAAASTILYCIETGASVTGDSIAVVLQYVRSEDFATVAALKSAARTTLAALIAWFGLFMAGQLGISVKAAGGALKADST